jgi:hypothetical protein
MKGNRSGVPQAPAVEEIAPDRFVVRDPRARPILNGEGELRGRFFELRSWRRDGLIARLRHIELIVSTLDDQLAGLPPLPAAESTGSNGWRALSSAIERFSSFSLTTCTWAPILPTVRDGRPGIDALIGYPLRRRKSRGAADFFIAAAERGGGLALRPSDETLALLMAYALMQRYGEPVVHAARRGDELHIPAIELPPPHRELLTRFTTHTSAGWIATGRGMQLTEALLGMLGLTCVITPTSVDVDQSA